MARPFFLLKLMIVPTRITNPNKRKMNPSCVKKVLIRSIIEPIKVRTEPALVFLIITYNRSGL